MFQFFLSKKFFLTSPHIFLLFKNFLLEMCYLAQNIYERKIFFCTRSFLSVKASLEGQAKLTKILFVKTTKNWMKSPTKNIFWNIFMTDIDLFLSFLPNSCQIYIYFGIKVTLILFTFNLYNPLLAWCEKRF